MPKQRVMVAMSGGVDSSVAALLTQRAGHEVIGLTAELFGDASAAGPCCGKAGISMASAVCEHLGIEHRQVDLSALFEAQVIDRFLDAYEAGRTPNPCADCNRFIKFDTFFEYANELGCELLATGHYARIVHPVLQAAVPVDIAAEQSEAGQLVQSFTGFQPVQGVQAGPPAPPVLAAAVDANKDQSYFLACIPPERLGRVRFPCGELLKPQVRELAEEAGLPTAQRKESQDVCFMSNGTGIRELLSWHRGRQPRPGALVDDVGRQLGTHAGIEHYTIGQRRGLNLGGGTEGLVVQRLDAATNTVTVAHRESHPIARLVLSDFTDLAPGRWRLGERVMVRGRYRQQLWLATVREMRNPDGGAAIAVEPDGDVNLMATGQWCVGYDGDVVLFGGIIQRIEYRS